ncbi:MAG: hypothetical protein QOG23_741 [Blastocatellia bacterium]|nr:hypothetical protein [Blastocatellia bacterium]
MAETINSMNSAIRESGRPLLTLTISKISESPENLTIEICLLRAGVLVNRCSVLVNPLAVSLSPSEREELRWYLEDFLMYPANPAPKVAARIEKWIDECGVRLFYSLFGPKSDAHHFWEEISDRIEEIRVEAVWESRIWPLIPLEFLRPGEGKPPLAVSAASFVHSNLQQPEAFQIEANRLGPIRILLIISRPAGLSDIPFRSIGIPLLRILGNRRDFRVEILRPPTIANLIARLSEARDQGRPFDMVHFDGHGIYDDLHARTTGQIRKNMRGYLVFENPLTSNNQELINGKLVGNYLVKAGVSYLILNACHSAQAHGDQAPAWSGDVKSDHAYPSLAQEVLAQGIPGVVGMRYAVYVSTAVRFMNHLYGSLSQGSTLSEAVQMGRRLLSSASESEDSVGPRHIQDWCVPVVYESAAKPLGRNSGVGTSSPTDLDSNWVIDPVLPDSPAGGVVGRDEAIMEIEHALASNHVVLLQGMAGTGKTTTAADFARWFVMTSAMKGVVVFTPLDQPQTLAKLFEQVDSFLTRTSLVKGISELKQKETPRSRILRLMKEIPVLWIWDDVAAVAEPFAKSATALTLEEQQDLRQFFVELKGSKARILLTSRSESRWLGEATERVSLSPMGSLDTLRFVQHLGARWNTQVSDIDTWWPVLQLARGNPLVTAFVFTLAFSEHLQSLDETELFVQRINQGKVRFDNEECTAWAKRLSSSMNRGFEGAFSEEEQRYLALLHIWSHINSSLLAAMGNPAIPHSVTSISAFQIQNWNALLDRVADLGLLERYNEGNYLPHPALQWFLTDLFDQFYAGQEFEVYRSAVEVLCMATQRWLATFEAGDPQLVNALYTANADLHAALEFARTHGLWDEVEIILGGLYSYYDIKGYIDDWIRVLKKVELDCTDAKSERPIPGRESLWFFVTRSRALLAKRQKQLVESARLCTLLLDWVKRNEDLATSRIRKVDLASSLHELGRVLLEQGDARCTGQFEEAMRMAEELGETKGAARCAYNLANAYLNITEIQDFQKAEAWAHRSLSLRTKTDYQAQAKSLSLLGVIIFEKFFANEPVAPDSASGSFEVLSPKKVRTDLPEPLREAVRYLEKALRILPLDDGINRADINSQMASLFHRLGSVDRALDRLRDAIKENDAAGRQFPAAKMRVNVASIFLEAGRLMDAYEYAHAAIAVLEPLGEPARELIAYAQHLIRTVALNLAIRGELPANQTDGGISDYIDVIKLDG